MTAPVQMQAVVEAVDTENALRSEVLTDARASKDLDINPQNIYEKLHPGRRLTTKLVSQDSRLTFSGVVLDAKDEMKFEYQCAVFLVPKVIPNIELYTSALRLCSFQCKG